MARRLNDETMRWLDTLCREGPAAGQGDAALLERFLTQPGAAGEAAFEAIVRRHGPMVLLACKRVLKGAHDADDAFQATFLVLARRAATLRDRDRLAPWLGRVARRVAARSRREALERAARERIGTRSEALEAPSAASHAALETAALVRGVVENLSAADRLPLQLTYWQGKSYEEAAAELSWPVGTVRSRLARARERLRGPLTRLGLAPLLAVAGVASLPEQASAQPSEALVRQTVRAAASHLGGLSAAGGAGTVPASVAALVDGELAMTAIIPWRLVAGLFLATGTVTLGGLTLAPKEPGDPKPAPQSAQAAGRQVHDRAGALAVKSARPAAADGELLANGGAEEGAGDAPRAWTTGASVAGVKYVWSRDSAHQGKASLCLKKTAPRYFPIAQWYQKVDRKGDAPRLKVSAWIKAEKAGKAILDAQFINADGDQTHAWVAYIGAQEANDPPVTHDWKRYEGVVAIPPGTKEIIVAPQIYGPGTVWFDDLSAEYTSDAETDPLGS